MARQKRTSTAIEKAQIRAASLQSINPTLDLGSSLTLAAYQAQISAAQGKLDVYNTKLSELDALLNDLQVSEKNLNTLSTRMLAGVGVVYGKDSSEYEQAGGTRTSEIARKSSSPTP